MKLRRESHSGFTLIELLVVMAVIGILSGLIFTGVTKVQNSAKKAKAKVQIKQLEKAFVAYHDEYGEWPTGLAGQGYDNITAEDTETGIEIEEKCAFMLAGAPTEGADGTLSNEQSIRYINKVVIAMSQEDPAWRKRGYLDPWGRCYKYMMDYNDDGLLVIKFTSGISTNKIKGLGVAVWSRGPDGSDGDIARRGDDITSWKLQ